MIVTVKAIYNDGRLIFQNKEDIPEDGTEVTVKLPLMVNNFEKRSKTPAVSLRGSWSKYFPAAIDIDEELQNLRAGIIENPYLSSPTKRGNS